MDVGQLVATVASQGVLLAALGWLIKSLVSSSLVRETERFKATLHQDNDAFRNQLEIDTHRRTTIFARLHEERAKVIAEVYALLAAAEQAVSSMVAPLQQAGALNEAELRNASAVAIAGFRDNFAAHRIWFPQPTCERAEAVLVELRGVHNYFSLVARGGGRPDGDNVQAWAESWERVQTQLPRLRAALEADFRGILGVENNPQAEGQRTR
jgi:hypothetical protein